MAKKNKKIKLATWCDVFFYTPPPRKLAGVYIDPYVRPFVRPTVPICNPLLL